MDFITAIVTGIGSAMTGIIKPIAETAVDAFGTLFWVAGTEGAGSLTILGQGLLAIAGIGLAVSAFYIAFRLLRGKLRHRM
jgi:hypothetical protein